MKDRLNLWLQQRHLEATKAKGDAVAIQNEYDFGRAEGKLEVIRAMLKEVNK